MAVTEPIVAIDLGGTRLRVALVDTQGNVVRRVAEETRSEEGPERVAQRIRDMAQGLLDEAGAAQPMAVGAALASPVDLEGVMHRPPNLTGWQVVPFKSMLAERFGVPVWVGNDANVAALGEHVFGAGKGIGDMIYLTISTGVGAGVITGGRLLLGARGLGGEIGHMIIARRPAPWQRAPASCGHIGCLESYVSGGAIARRAVAGLREGRRSSLAELSGGDVESIEAKQVFQAAAQGDAFAGELIEAVGRDLALGLASLIHLFNPRKFIIGGGVSRNWAMLEKSVLDELRRQVMPGFLDDLEIVVSQFGDDVGLVGAAALVVQEIGAGTGPSSGHERGRPSPAAKR
ncbi:MAG: ROK family protein [Chloroflexi bacterium]|nr:ROK family protein [Chloroflexota bacterium]